MTFLSLHSMEGLWTLNDKWKVIKTQTCRSLHLKMCSQSQLSGALILLLGGNVPLTKGWLESAVRSLSETERKTLSYSFFISNFSTRFPQVSPQRGTRAVRNCQAGMIKTKFLPASHCTLQNWAVYGIKHMVISSSCKNPM